MIAQATKGCQEPTHPSRPGASVPTRTAGMAGVPGAPPAIRRSGKSIVLMVASGGCEPPGYSNYRGVHTPRSPTSGGAPNKVGLPAIQTPRYTCPAERIVFSPKRARCKEAAMSRVLSLLSLALVLGPTALRAADDPARDIVHRALEASGL